MFFAVNKNGNFCSTGYHVNCTHSYVGLETDGMQCTSPWWRHGNTDWPFVRGIHRLPVDSSHKGSVMWSLICFISRMALLNKQLSCQDFEIAWHSCDVTVIPFHIQFISIQGISSEMFRKIPLAIITTLVRVMACGLHALHRASHVDQDDPCTQACNAGYPVM